VTEEGYVGIEVHCGSRICAAAHGGQTLVSSRTRELLRGAQELTDLGEHRLKDLPGPQRLYQIGADEFPALRGLHWTNVPAPSTPLVGREGELVELGRLLREHRLVTIVGSGGVGKTRLALEVAANAAPDFSDGVWWVPLESLGRPVLVEPAIGEVVRATDALGDHLRERNTLLVLDNFEHVMEAAPVLASLLAHSRGVKMLVTSREALRLSAEQRFTLQPLPARDAIALFDSRARAVRPVHVTSPAVGEICSRLDGLPLAIELAASRIGALSAEELAARLAQRLPLLVGGVRDAPARRRTLAATFEWSYDLLDDEERHLFARLGVFAGGCTLASAEAVVGARVETMASLVDKSLLRREEKRFTMLETLREFAVDVLSGSADAETLRRDHARHFLGLAREMGERLRGPDQYELIARLGEEEPNLRDALTWLLDAEPEHALELAVQLETLWVVRGRPSESAHWLQSALRSAPDANPELRSRALRGVGDALVWLGERVRASEFYEASLEVAEGAGAEVAAADAQLALGRVGDALARYERRDAHIGVANCLHVLGVTARDAGDFGRARELLDQSLAITRRHGSPASMAAVLHTAGDCTLDQGRDDEAAALYRESLDIAIRLDTDVVAYCLGGLAAVEARRGRRASALRLWEGVRAFERERGLRLEKAERQRYERALSTIERSESYGSLDHEDGGKFRETAAYALALD
jgi:predicted ATPase